MNVFCHFAYPNQTIATVEGLDSREDTTTVPINCTNPQYSSTALINNVKTIQVIHGEFLPANFRTTLALDIFGQADIPFKNETKLISLRRIRGEWFITRSMDVVVDRDDDTIIDRERDYYLISDIHRECREISSNYLNECPTFEGSSLLGLDDSGWERIIFTPNINKYPIDNLPIQDERISEECTDDNPC